MSFSTVYEVFIRKSLGSDNPLVRSKADASPVDPPKWVAGNTFTLRVHFCDDPATPLNPLVGSQIDAGDQIIVMGKLPDALSGDALCNALAFTEVHVAGEYYYEAVLDLDVDTLIAAVGADTTTLSFEVRVQTAGNVKRLSYLFPASILPRVYQGTEAGSPSGNIEYPAPNEIMLIGAPMNYDDGAIYSDGAGGLYANYFGGGGVYANYFYGDGSGLTGVQMPLVAGVDYLTPTGDGSGLSGVQMPLVAGVDYLTPTGDASGLTNIPIPFDQSLNSTDNALFNTIATTNGGFSVNESGTVTLNGSDGGTLVIGDNQITTVGAGPGLLRIFTGGGNGLDIFPHYIQGVDDSWFFGKTGISACNENFKVNGYGVISTASGLGLFGVAPVDAQPANIPALAGEADLPTVIAALNNLLGSVIAPFGLMAAS